MALAGRPPRYRHCVFHRMLTVAGDVRSELPPLCVRYEEDGIDGLRDRRIGKVSPRRALARELERMHELYRERYSDFTVKHFSSVVMHAAPKASNLRSAAATEPDRANLRSWYCHRFCR